ncbi:MAG TPA: thioredoxin domain-containing protein [Chthoniobacterales bacterium]|nr:thioredoxin domain-containing protein [Chthoniobacterales bacterium]
MRRYLPFAIVAIVAILAVGGGTYLYHAKASSLSGSRIHGESAETADSDHVLGPAEARVVLEEYGDFQCPPCGHLSDPINELQKEYNIRLVFREFPLVDFHKHALEAAYAAEAAGLQGHFWQMHDLLYRQQPIWSSAPDVRQLFDHYASLMGLDVERFNRDMDNERVHQRVAADQKKGESLGVKNTPTIFLNAQEIDRMHLNPAGLHDAIEAAIKTNKPSS